MSKNMIIPIFIPHKGCPFDCVYCNQKSISGEIEEVNVISIEEKISEYLKTADSNKIIDVAFYGGSFTGIDIDEQKKYLDCVTKYILEGKIRGIKMSTRPDYISEDILTFLSGYKIDLIELGVQSFDEEVLLNSNRGHNVSDVYNAVSLLKKYNMKYGIQTMIGLLGDTLEKSLDTAREVVALRPNTVRIYPTLVIRDTYLEKIYLKGMYKPLDLDEAVNISTKLLKIYNENGINVIRLGLQPTENLEFGKDIVAGPFHPSFRQIVESKMYCNDIVNKLKNISMKNDSNIIIYANRKIISNIVGMNKMNVKFILNSFNCKNVYIKENNDINEYVIETD